MELEGIEQEIYLQPEMAIVGAVYSVNGYTGHVVLTTSDLENTSGYQTSTDVANLISAHNISEEAHPYIQNLISAKQDPIVAGNGISITGGNTIAIDTTVVATQQNLATEVTNRENADIALQGQIDAISASSDVVDIVGTYQELQNYDTQHLKDNDIIKVLQDSTQGNATTYYRWSTSTHTFTLIGQEGPYYTKAGADAQFVPQTRTINSKPLSANITLTASDVSALGQSDIVQTTGTSTSQVMSQNAVTTALATKLDSADVPAGFFDGPATTSPTPATSVELNNVLKLSELELLGDTAQDTTTGKNLLPPVDNFEVEEADVNIKYADGVYTINGTSTGSGAHTTPWTTPVVSYTIKSGDYWHYKNDFTSSQLNIQVRFTDTTTFAQSISSMDRIIDLTDYAGKTIQDMRVYFQSGYSFNGTISPMIVNNVSTSTAYEPYTGGPSPNPDYPQTVDVVTGEQNILVTGKNLFSTAFSTDFTATSNNTFTLHRTNLRVTRFWFPYDLPAGTYTLSLKITSSTASQGLNLNFFDANSQQITNISTIKTTPYSRTITLPRPLNMIYAFIQTGDAASSSITVEDFQIEQGESATDFAPYQGMQSYTVDLGATELCKIGNYQDYIYQGSDGWYVHKATGKRDVTSVSSIYSSAGSGYIGAQFDVTDMASNSRMNGYCNILIPMNSPSGATTEGITFGASNAYVYIILKSSRMASSTVANWNAWLASNATTIYYPLATATDTKITDTTLTGQLDALLSAQLYPEYTVISSNGNLPAILGVTAYNSNLNGIIEVLASTASTLGNINSALNIINNGGN